MVFCKEDNRALLQALKNLVQRDREAGEYVPPNFDSILQSLDNMSAENEDVAVPSRPADTRTTYSPGREEFEILQAYNTLIKAGGRPICPLGETASISKHPGRYLEILGPWVKAPLVNLAIDWKGIFEQQLSNWQLFRAWQQSNRQVEALPDIDMTDTLLEDSTAGGRRSSASSGYDSRWTRFETHLAMARRRLSHCGFTKSFTFDLDSGRQDEWTTWIEYLSFECYCCDAHHVSSYGCPADPPKEAQCDAHACRKDAYSMVVGAGSKKDGIVPCVGGLISSRPGGTYSGVGTVSGQVNGTNHHNLILRWALLQEPEIAAKSAASQGGPGAAGDPWPTTHGSQRKRHWDGSLCNTRPVVFQNEALGQTKDIGDLEHKRFRNCI